jgi:hypothetical protein
VKLPDPAVEVHATCLFDVELRAVFEPPLALTLLAPERRRKMSAGLEDFAASGNHAAFAAVRRTRWKFSSGS